MIKLFKSAVSFFFDFLETIVVALSVFVVIYLFIIQPHEVKGSSMEPSFKNNEYIITDKISYRFGSPQRGDVVIFKAPVNLEVDYIKRIIGLPGEKIMIAKGKVYVNDKLLSEPYLEEITSLFPGGFVQDGVTIDIPEEHYFVMGDNRPHSSDSREFGPINHKLIIGKAIFRYWPINGLGLIPHISYRLGV
ncbi:signal peptidase I [Candidatus Gottesmanbacteria bacterium RBG_16_37_8]|uniref:Signal peptidase I n=1 Tax=Candidatus Gottesmanbacteria bacterium RBG_16_37_8 TaxID=1798371 RepID=A0A1F5YRU3_9BACT|nr:MAG: signal peptidase I [Candidatus Gottesmanbacteria bacterium RBG_16_37_8]